jgi:hypothetical protein
MLSEQAPDRRTAASICCRGHYRFDLEALVVTDATKKLREPVAYLLLAFVGVYALASLLGLFVGDEFTSAARVVQGNLAAPGISGIALLVALAGAVFLVTEFGEPTPNARTVTLAALVLVGVLSLILLIAAIAGFSNDGDALPKVVGFLYDVGGLALYALVGFLILRTFQALPAPAKAIGAQGAQGVQGQYGGQPQYGVQQGGYDASQYGGQYGGQPYAGQQGQYDAGQGQYAGQYGDAGQGQYAGQYGGYAPQQGAEHASADQSAWAYDTEGGVESGTSHEAAQQWGGGQQWGSQQADAGDQWSQGGDTQQWPRASESSPSQWGQDAGQWPSDAGEQQWGQQQGWGQQSQQTQSWEQPAEADAGDAAPAWQSSESGATDTDHDSADAGDAKPAESSDARDEDDGSNGPAKKDDQQGWWSQPPQ